MKVLLDTDYTWHEATWDYVRGGFTIGDDPYIVSETSIISISGENRNKYVKCKSCGETILNTPAAIKKHYELSKTSKTCLSCRHCGRRDTKIINEKIVMDDDGTYNITTKSNTQLYCGYSYSRYPIDSESARTACRYTKCQNLGMQTCQDIFSKYPGIFDDILTVDVLIKNKWEFIDKDYRGYSTFKVPIKFNFYAVVSPQGFINYFYYQYRNTQYKFRYSPKYAKLIWVSWTGYKETMPIDVSDSIIEKITKKVIELYKEVDKE